MEGEEKSGVEYDGFATPSFICEGSDIEKRGSIYDEYSTLPNGSKLVVGQWSRGFQDSLIHIWLIKPVTVLCDERKEWAASKTLLKEPINYSSPLTAEIVTINEIKSKHIPQKKKMVLDPETKQFRLI